MVFKQLSLRYRLEITEFVSRIARLSFSRKLINWQILIYHPLSLITKKVLTSVFSGKKATLAWGEVLEVKSRFSQTRSDIG